MSRPLIGWRGVLAGGLLLVAGAAAGWLWWNHTAREREIARLRQAIEQLTASYPVARLVVTEQGPDLAGGVRTRVRVSLLDDAGRRRGERMETVLSGSRIYFEALLILFQDPFVERGERRSMAFPTRLFSEEVAPRDGFELALLDAAGVPVSYDRSVAPGGLTLEDYRDILRRFWHLANHPNEAAGLGIRVVQGEAVFTDYEPGRYYQVLVEADGGLVLEPEFHWLDD